MLRHLTCAALCALILLPAATSEAAKRVRGQYTVSKQPYWRVGKIDKVLSAACQKGEFGQRQYLRYNIGFIGPKGRSVTGIATSGWNLRDPKRLAQSRKTYHFFNQGYSNCKVYVSDQPRRRR